MILSDTFMPKSDIYQHLQRYQHSSSHVAAFRCNILLKTFGGGILILEWRLFEIGSKLNSVKVSNNNNALPFAPEYAVHISILYRSMMYNIL